MLTLRSDLRIMVAAWPVDFRRGMDSLAMLVSETLRKDPFCGDLFIFRSKRSDRIKILTWDGTGLVLYSKRLESGRRRATLAFVEWLGLEEDAATRCG
jgi:transposase